MFRKNQTQASFRQIRGNLVSVGLCIFEIWLLVQMEANVHSKNACQQHSPLQAPPVVLAAPDATPGTQILPSFAVMLTPKSRFRSGFLEFTLNFSGLSIILCNSGTKTRNPHVNCSDNLQIGALGTSNSNL